MKLSLIVAMDKNRVIGRDGKLPWHLSDDLKNFKKITLNKPVIMGRKTHESIGKPLPGRKNIIITRNENYQAQGCEVCHDLNEALKLCASDEEAVIIGGAEIYSQALDRVDRIYLTEVYAEVEGDVYFPEYGRESWDEIIRDDYEANDKNDYPFSCFILERRHPLYW
jgi:dihydrofolate reductase